MLGDPHTVAFDKLVGLLRYVDGDCADAATFAALRQALGDARHPAHDLAIPPALLGPVVEQLAKAGCTDGARVVVEKPLGPRPGAFLECGILAHGFLRLRCGDCGHDKLLAFSCKRRGFCPSCGARRMAQAMGEQAVTGSKVSAAQVAQLVFDAMNANHFHVYSHPQTPTGVQVRLEDLMTPHKPSDPFAARPELGQRLRDALA